MSFKMIAKAPLKQSDMFLKEEDDILDSEIDKVVESKQIKVKEFKIEEDEEQKDEENLDESEEKDDEEYTFSRVCSFDRCSVF